MVMALSSHLKKATVPLAAFFIFLSDPRSYRRLLTRYFVALWLKPSHESFRLGAKYITVTRPCRCSWYCLRDFHHRDLSSSYSLQSGRVSDGEHHRSLLSGIALFSVSIPHLLLPCCRSGLSLLLHRQSWWSKFHILGI